VLLDAAKKLKFKPSIQAKNAGKRSAVEITPPNVQIPKTKC